MCVFVDSVKGVWCFQVRCRGSLACRGCLNLASICETLPLSALSRLVETHVYYDGRCGLLGGETWLISHAPHARVSVAPPMNGGLSCAGLLTTCSSSPVSEHWPRTHNPLPTSQRVAAMDVTNVDVDALGRLVAMGFTVDAAADALKR